MKSPEDVLEQFRVSDHLHPDCQVFDYNDEPIFKANGFQLLMKDVEPDRAALALDSDGHCVYYREFADRLDQYAAAGADVTGMPRNPIEFVLQGTT